MRCASCIRLLLRNKCYNNPMQIDLLIFDLDGTLLNSKQTIIDSINFMLQKLGKKEKPAYLIASYIGIGDRHLIEESVDGDQALVDKGLEIFRADYPPRIAKEGKLFAGTVEMLEKFKNKKKVAFSNGRRVMLELNFKKHGLEGYFDQLIGGDDPALAKPNPYYINQLLTEFNVEPAKAMMVGDLVIDIQTGKNAGIKTCAATYGIGLPADLTSTKPDLIIDDIRDLMRLVK